MKLKKQKTTAKINQSFKFIQHKQKKTQKTDMPFGFIAACF